MSDREAIVIEMENEGVVTWGDDRHRARFLAIESVAAPATAFAWLIEQGQHSGYPEDYEPPIYYAAVQRKDYNTWTRDPFAAMRFATEADCALFMERSRDGDRPMPGYPAEHGFIP